MTYLVATVLTACGIETHVQMQYHIHFDGYQVATVLTACGIETNLMQLLLLWIGNVATVLTACGIETIFYIIL